MTLNYSKSKTRAQPLKAKSDPSARRRGARVAITGTFQPDTECDVWENFFLLSAGGKRAEQTARPHRLH